MCEPLEWDSGTDHGLGTLMHLGHKFSQLGSEVRVEQKGTESSPFLNVGVHLFHYNFKNNALLPIRCLQIKTVGANWKIIFPNIFYIQWLRCKFKSLSIKLDAIWVCQPWAAPGKQGCELGGSGSGAPGALASTHNWSLTLLARCQYWGHTGPSSHPEQRLLSWAVPWARWLLWVSLSPTIIRARGLLLARQL